MPNDELFAVEFLIDTTLPDGSKYSAGARTILPAYEARTRAGAGIPDLKILGYAAEFPTIQPPAAARRKTSPVLFANLPAASAANDGDEVDVTDLNGGTRFRSNGVAWVQVSPGVTENAVTYSTWAGRNQGSPYIGQCKRITDIGNQNPEFIYNGTRWLPKGLQLAYRQSGVVNGTAGASSTATGATFNTQPGMMGPDGTVLVEVDYAANTAPVAATPQMTWAGSNLHDGASVGTRRNVKVTRTIRNAGAENAQNVSEGSTQLVIEGSANAQVQTFAIDTAAAARAIVPSITFTHASSIVATIHRYEVWLVP